MKIELLLIAALFTIACDSEEGGGQEADSEDFYECEAHSWDELGQDKERYEVDIGEIVSVLTGDWAGTFANEEAGTSEITVSFGDLTGEVYYKLPVLTPTGKEQGVVIGEEEWDHCLGIDFTAQCQGEIAGGSLARKFSNTCSLAIEGDGSLQDTTGNWLETVVLKGLGEVNEGSDYLLGFGDDGLFWMVIMDNWGTMEYSCVEIGNKTDNQ
jgi:hypothetical protein